MRSRHLATSLAVPAAALLLGACGGSHPSTPVAAVRPSTTSTHTTADPASGPAVVAVLHTPGHHPRAGAWPITLRLTRAGVPIAGHVSYAFLFGGQVVSTQPVAGESADFVGRFHDTILWPARSAGLPLTFRVIIKTAYGTTTVDYPVVVQH